MAAGAMVRPGRRTALTGPSLVRLLARLIEADVPESRLPFAQRLGHWLGWADAISLFSALGPQAVGEAQPCPADPRADADRVRSQLAASLAIPPDDAEPQGDYAPWRRHYTARQHAMDKSVAPLRERLRRQLAARSADMARLAEVDAVMEQVLAPQEQRLLATVPGWLGKHFERLRRAGDSHFPQDMQAVLLAELDLRMTPVEGLLDALGAGHDSAGT